MVKCCLCHNQFCGYSHNAQPIMSGRCCEKCNEQYILPIRFYDFLKNVSEKMEKEKRKNTLQNKNIKSKKGIIKNLKGGHR